MSCCLALYRFPDLCCCGCRSSQPRNSALKVVRPSRGGDPLAWLASDRTWSFVCYYPVVVIWPPTLPPSSVVVGSLVSGILGGFLLLFSYWDSQLLHRSNRRNSANFRQNFWRFCWKYRKNLQKSENFSEILQRLRAKICKF